ncbi:MAG: Smr/MutS family protein, partial [Anaerolineae bacterium]|nr:Smr/MutS family protein [Anaerolineae bacterium]
QRARNEAQAARAEAERQRRAVQALEADLRYRLARIEEARREVINEARAIAQAELEEARAEIARLRRRLALAQTTGSSHERFLAEAEAELQRRARELTSLPESAVPERQEAPMSPLQVGDVVWVPSLHSMGRITELDADGELAEVQIGAFRLRLPIARLEFRERATEAPDPAMLNLGRLPHPSPGIELDLRGQTVEEVLPRLDKYLDDAYLAGLPWVRIIHGKGTGTLRRAVREALARHPLVAEIRPGEYNEGGDGVTVARLIGVHT